MHDIRYALRALRKQPLFTLVAVLTLALGIGANTAIFSLLYQVLLRPLPYPDAERLVFVWNMYPLMGLPQASVSIPDYIDRKTQAPAIEDATLFTGGSANLADGGQPEQVRALMVTPSFFTTLQRQPFLGRGFTEDEARPDADNFVILSYGLWQSRYGGDRTLVGRDIRMNGEAYRVVGVMAADFRLTNDVGVYVPFAFTPQQMSDQARGNEFSQMIARLKPGATIEQLNGQMKMIVERNMERLPQRQAFAKIERVRRLRGRHPPAAGRRGAHAAVCAAGRRARGAADRLRQRRQPSADARHRPISRAGDPHDPRRRSVAAGAADDHRGRGALPARSGRQDWRWDGSVVRTLIALSSRQLPGIADASLHPAGPALHPGARRRSRAWCSAWCPRCR